MFTGIIEELGTVIARDSLSDAARLTVSAPATAAQAGIGESVAVNGVCLTVAAGGAGQFTADVMRETLQRSSLGALAPGDRVNLERPVTLSGRLGGHLVQGHVDGVATILDRQAASHWEVVRVGLQPALARYVVEQGSVTVDGVSLTVVEAGDDSFTVSLIPTTLALTTLGRKGPGDPVNIEVDIIAKYVERLLGSGPGRPG
ncbi:MAG: riboflavin synthase [Pseudonocardiales bacterium]